ncbi:MAG: ATP-binding cassette domain-containing protein, partial [Actinomycetota bacterium]|nr:ATP-binding cassette domain-containing protein [Actinomycetota bacterium]
MNALTVHGLRKRFVRHLQGAHELSVLEGVDLEVQAGTCTVLRGSSGSGKSSLLRCVYRTYRPDAGSIVLRAEGERIDLATADDRAVLSARRRLIGMATQFLQITPRVGAVDLVAQEGLEREHAAELLRSLGLAEELLEVAPATFSGGERQIVNLAITLARPRPVLLLDEVTAS